MTPPSARVLAPWSDGVIRFSMAVAAAEGSDPAWNNPGDLTGMDSGGFPTVGFGNKEGVWKFLNADDGWTALFIKIHRMLSGKSMVYPPTMTLMQMGMKYSGGDPNWALNVSNILDVSEELTLQQIAVMLKV